MFIQTIKLAFSQWWGKLGYSFLGAILGALNPFFFFIVSVIIWALSGHLDMVIENYPVYLVYGAVFILAANVFPTTFAVFGIQKMILEGEQLYFRQYFKNWWKCLCENILPSIVLTLGYGVLGLLIAVAGLFYFQMFDNTVIKFAIAIFLAWVYLFLLLTQVVVIPLFVYNKGIEFGFALPLVSKLVIIEFFPIAGIFLLDSILFIMLTLGKGFSFLSYYGIATYLRIYIYKAIVKKYNPPSKEGVEEDTDSDNTKSKEAWASLMRRDHQED